MPRGGGTPGDGRADVVLVVPQPVRHPADRDRRVEEELPLRRHRRHVLLQPGARARLFSRWRALSVRILTDVNVGSDLRSLLRRH